MAGIKHGQLKLLAENGGIKGVTIIGNAAGFALNIATLSGERPLFTKTGQMRFFKKMETLLDYLKTEVGIGKATIQFDRWNAADTILEGEC
jgi:hypothetical protein